MVHRGLCSTSPTLQHLDCRSNHPLEHCWSLWERVLQSQVLAIQFSSLDRTHTISIHDIFFRTDHTAYSTTRAPCTQKEEEPEIPGNSTNNHHRRWSVPLHKWQMRKGVLKRKAQHILHYQLQRNKQKFRAKSKIPEESKETTKNQSSRSNIWISGIPRMKKENEEKEII